MATTEKTPVMDSSISTKVSKKKTESNAAKVSIIIPKNENGDPDKEDQNEYVTVNGKTTKIPRGEYVDVSVPVFIQLRNRYPHL